jgi:alpha-tubulin suppressor-like RCC1 family protein
VIATACESTFALDSEGYAWAIGLNLLGQLGDGTNTTRDCWVRVCCNYQYCKLASTGVHTIGLKTDGTLVAWGSGVCGGLGDGTTTGQCQPVAVCCNYCYCDIAVGVQGLNPLSFGIKTDGTAVAWGVNVYGVLGNGEQFVLPKCQPVAVCCNYCYQKIATSGGMAVGIKTDGTAVAWGNNGCGGLGDGTTVNKCQPVAVCCNYCYCDIANVSGSLYEAAVVGIKTDGTAVSWGSGSGGKLGSGAITPRCVPGAVCCNYCYKKISSSISTTAMSFIGIKCDNTAVSWGCGTCGQLGDGTVAAKCQPVAVCCNYCYDHISGGKCYYVGLRTDGVAVSWGDNSNYKLGDRTITDRCQPGLMCNLI